MDENRALRDFITPNVHGLHSSIVCPPIKANNFEIKPFLLSMVQQNRFLGSPLKDPLIYLSIFL